MSSCCCLKQAVAAVSGSLGSQQFGSSGEVAFALQLPETARNRMEEDSLSRLEMIEALSRSDPMIPRPTGAVKEVSEEYDREGTESIEALLLLCSFNDAGRRCCLAGLAERLSIQALPAITAAAKLPWAH